MHPIPKRPFWQRKPLAVLLGLELDGNRLEGVVVRRQNGLLQPSQAFTATLALDPLTNDPELVGREILNHLEAAGIRERHCTVAMPLKWALTAQAAIPVMPEADAASFLQIEAERGFPCDAATLRVATSRYTAPSGACHALFVGVPADHLQRLERALRAARLKPLGFSPGIAALQPPSAEASQGVLAVVLGESQVALQVTCGGGVAALRALDGMLETDAGRRVVNAELIARETRITLGQLAPECRAAVTRIRVFGAPILARDLVHAIAPRFEPLGLRCEAVEHYAVDEFGAPVPSEAVVSAAFSLAARRLTGLADAFEFLAPRVSPWTRITKRYASGKLRAAGAAAAVLVLVLGGAFGIQQWQLFRLNSRWTRMAARVGELQAVEQQVRQYRPWFDDTFRSLTILRELTLVFPEDGTVTAKTVEIRDRHAVSCSGTAHDHAALLRTLSQLRAVAGVHDVKVDQIRGKAPLQFTFGFQYGTEAAHDK